SGTVAAVDNDPLWGITVTVDHGNGIITRYSNLNEGVTVQVGQEVGSGEEIGAVGETADIETSEESHLHFEMVKNGSYVNPLEIIG
ncbi:MAG: peptidoglycan DD-metalloendopeptidase family protein, partial [Porcipelethomonas sp.]